MDRIPSETQFVVEVVEVGPSRVLAGRRHSCVHGWRSLWYDGVGGRATGDCAGRGGGPEPGRG